MRDSVIFYRSFYDAAKELDQQSRAEVYDAIFDYQFTGTEPDLQGVKKAIWLLIKPQLDANIKRYEDGKKGGRPPKKTSGSVQGKPVVSNIVDSVETKPKPNVNVNQNENENVNVNVNVNQNGGLFRIARYIGDKETKSFRGILPGSDIYFYMNDFDRWVNSAPDKRTPTKNPVGAFLNWCKKAR